MRERIQQVVTMLGQGLCVKEVASILGITDKTVASHWAVAKTVLGFKSYVDAAHYCLAHGLIRNAQRISDELREAVNEV